MTDLWTIVLPLSAPRIESRPRFGNCTEGTNCWAFPCRLTQCVSLQVQLNCKPKLKWKIKIATSSYCLHQAKQYIYIFFASWQSNRECRKQANRRAFAGFRKGVEKVSGVMSNKSSSENERKGVEDGGESSDAVRLRDGGAEEKTAGWAAGSRD